MLIKPLSRSFAEHPVILGAAVGADSEILPVLDVPNLFGQVTRTRAAVRRTVVEQQLEEEEEALLIVLIVDDSRTFRRAITKMLRAEPDIELVIEASDGLEAVEVAEDERPALIVTDLEMPNLDGYGAIDRIMRSEGACPIVVLSASVDGPSSYAAARCFEVGAVEVLRKPTSMSVGQFRRRLIGVLRTMSRARVVRRTGPPAPTDKYGGPVERPATPGPAPVAAVAPKRPLPCPVVIAQHILPGFDAGLAKWLQNSGHEVVLFKEDTPVARSAVYLAPGDAHMVFENGRLTLTKPADADMVPSADKLLASIAEVYGHRVLGMVLTGMGRDGARGLKANLDAGGTTWTQSAETCAVNGMPQAARDVGASQQALSPDELVAALTQRLLAKVA